MQTKQTLIQAASLLVIEHGAQNLTLEAVAAAAGVSKGGLLYHFPSKEALIVGMIQHFIDHIEQRLAAHLSIPDPTPEQWLRAYVHASFETDPDEDAISAALMAAVGINPHLLDPVRALLVARTLNRLEPVASALGDGVTLLTADVTDRASLEALAATCEQQFGRVNVGAFHFGASL